MRGGVLLCCDVPSSNDMAWLTSMPRYLDKELVPCLVSLIPANIPRRFAQIQRSWPRALGINLSCNLHTGPVTGSVLFPTSDAGSFLLPSSSQVWSASEETRPQTAKRDLPTCSSLPGSSLSGRLSLLHMERACRRAPPLFPIQQPAHGSDLVESATLQGPLPIVFAAGWLHGHSGILCDPSPVDIRIG